MSAVTMVTPPPPPPPQVSQVVMKVKQLVSVANISGALASTVVTIISNVLSSSEMAMAPTSETCVPRPPVPTATAPLMSLPVCSRCRSAPPGL